MNTPATSFDWNQVRAFLATAENGSLSAAARALGLTQPTLGRQVSALEHSLGVVLFERVGRGLELTPTGRDLLQHVRAMGEAAARVSLTATGQSQTIEGQVCITASDATSAYLLPPLLAELRDIAPGVTIDIVATNDIRDLQRREADIAIRHTRPEQPELIAKLLRQSHAYFYASDSYVRANGTPKDLTELPQHQLIGFQPIAQFISHLSHFGLPLAENDFRLVTESGVVGWELVKQGLGIGAMSAEVAELTPNVQIAMPWLAPIPVPTWLTAHRELMTSRRIRLVYDFLAEALSR